jgi:hypothetical protein
MTAGCALLQCGLAEGCHRQSSAHSYADRAAGVTSKKQIMVFLHAGLRIPSSIEPGSRNLISALSRYQDEPGHSNGQRIPTLAGRPARCDCVCVAVDSRRHAACLRPGAGRRQPTSGPAAGCCFAAVSRQKSSAVALRRLFRIHNYVCGKVCVCWFCAIIL